MSKKWLAKTRQYLDKNHRTYRVIESSAPGHLERLAREHASKDTLVVALGGDGTVNEVMKGVLRSPSLMGIVPCGSGNDIATTLGITTKNALSTLLKGNPKKLEVALVNEKPFLGVASCGLDTEVNRTANQLPRIIKGPLLYTLALLIALVRFKAMDITVRTPHATLKEKVMLLAVGQGTSYGGGMKITSQALRDDELLDLCMVKKISKWKLLGIFPKVFSGRHIDHPSIAYYQLPYLSIEGIGEVFADGDYKTKLPAHYCIKKDFLTLLAPA